MWIWKGEEKVNQMMQVMLEMIFQVFYLKSMHAVETIVVKKHCYFF